MASAIPFISYFVGDGSSSSFTLDVSADPYYLANDITLNSAESLPSPSVNFLSKGGNNLSTPSAVALGAAKNALNNNDLGYSSASFSGSQVTFSLSSTPAAGVLIAIYGFMAF